ncbi:uncharacterized protein LOC143194093 isoform X1 [Rhynchophorus ferrugineus]|uniref:uncharacterized protein LOC143194093 isoform X1 n=1 Tax=Rhynchophorus ferrugineus TaxID=354439 RepID=UPI003FCC7DE1
MDNKKQGSLQVFILPPKWTIKNKDHFKCSSCRKYLSVSPIFSSPGCSENYCGRCSEYHHLPRNLLFERLSQNVEFPCSVSEECTTPVQWNATQHEKCCPYITSPCPVFVCSEPIQLKSFVNHFRAKHAENIEHTGDFLLNFKRSYSFIKRTYHKVIEFRSRQYLASISINRNYFRINVFDIGGFNLSKRDFFSVVLRAGETRIKFSTLAQVKQFSFDDTVPDYLDQALELNVSILNIEHNGSNRVHKVYVTLEFHSSNDMATFPSTNCMSFLKEALCCPICFCRMAVMGVCKTGHSICGECIKNLNNCPFCQDLFANFRNETLGILANVYEIKNTEN